MHHGHTGTSRWLGATDVSWLKRLWLMIPIVQCENCHMTRLHVRTHRSHPSTIIIHTHCHINCSELMMKSLSAELLLRCLLTDSQSASNVSAADSFVIFCSGSNYFSSVTCVFVSGCSSREQTPAVCPWRVTGLWINLLALKREGKKTTHLHYSESAALCCPLQDNPVREAGVDLL